jgi:hypothetical protein
MPQHFASLEMIWRLIRVVQVARQECLRCWTWACFAAKIVVAPCEVVWLCNVSRGEALFSRAADWQRMLGARGRGREMQILMGANAWGFMPIFGWNKSASLTFWFMLHQSCFRLYVWQEKPSAFPSSAGWARLFEAKRHNLAWQGCMFLVWTARSQVQPALLCQAGAANTHLLHQFDWCTKKVANELR